MGTMKTPRVGQLPSHNPHFFCFVLFSPLSMKTSFVNETSRLNHSTNSNGIGFSPLEETSKFTWLEVSFISPIPADTCCTFPFFHAYTKHYSLSLSLWPTSLRPLFQHSSILSHMITAHACAFSHFEFSPCFFLFSPCFSKSSLLNSLGRFSSCLLASLLSTI